MFVSLSKMLSLHRIIRLRCELSTSWEHPPEVYLLSAISLTEEIEHKNRRTFYQHGYPLDKLFGIPSGWYNKSCNFVEFYS